MTPEVMDWIERLGGWGVVLLVVRWMMSRMDRQLTSLESAIQTFQAFETAEKDAHDAILRGLRKIEDRLSRPSE